MCANVDRLKWKVIDNLSSLTQLVCDWESLCSGTDDNRRRFREIRLLIDRMRDHVQLVQVEVDEGFQPTRESMEVLRTVEEGLVIKTQKMINREENKEEVEENVVNIPAAIIEKKINQERSTVNFRNKDVRKTSSWIYLDKWEEILDEELSLVNNNNNNNECVNRNFKRDSFNGVNLVVQKRIHQFGGSNKQKYNSTECILDESIEESLEEASRKKFASTGNLLDDYNEEINDLNFRQYVYGSSYLLSLRDLQSFDKLDKITDSDSENYNSDCEINIHKPKIVGVIYKDKL